MPPIDFTVVKYEVESWQLRSVSPAAPPNECTKSKKKSPPLKRFHSTSDHPTLTPPRTQMGSESEHGLDQKRDIRICFHSAPPRLRRRVRRSVYLYLRPSTIERVHKLLSSDTTLPLNLPNPPPGQNTSTRHSKQWDVSSQEVKGQRRWPNLITSLPTTQ